MTFEQLYDMTPSAFWNAVDGFFLQKENEQRMEWVRIRWSTCNLINVHLTRGKQMKPHSLLKFDWEKDASNHETLKEVMFKYEKSEKLKNSR